MTDIEPQVTEEFADYMRSQSRRYLQRVRSTVHTVMMIRSEIAELESAMDGLKGVDYSRDRVSVPASDDGMVNAIARIELLRDEYRDELESNLQSQADAHAALRHVRQPWRSVLTYRYLVGMAWADVADQVGYSVDHCKSDLHDNGLMELYRFIPHDELPSAFLI